MKTNQEKPQSGMFNFLTLLGLLSGVFLIIFLKHRGGKKTEHPEAEVPERVKNSNNKEKEQNEIYSELNSRQKQILDMLREKGRMQPKEIYSVVPDVSTRTVRRDMDILVENDLVKQVGTTKATTYIFKNSN
jgi:predicted HTH transcriptional regulator